MEGILLPGCTLKIMDLEVGTEEVVVGVGMEVAAEEAMGAEGEFGTEEEVEVEVDEVSLVFSHTLFSWTGSRYSTVADAADDRRGGGGGRGGGRGGGQGYGGSRETEVESTERRLKKMIIRFAEEEVCLRMNHPEFF